MLKLMLRKCLSKIITPPPPLPFVKDEVDDIKKAQKMAKKEWGVGLGMWYTGY
jgi:hypothetical protein